MLGNRRRCVDESAVSALAALRRLAEDCTKPMAMLPCTSGPPALGTASGGSRTAAGLVRLARSARLKRGMDVVVALLMLLVILPASQ